MNSAFRGSLMGVLVGDAVGARFEGGSRVNPQNLLEHIKGLIEIPSTNGHPSGHNQSQIGAASKSISKSEKTLRYTDDTAMTKSTCKSILSKKGLNATDMAKEYTESFFNDPHRGYGASVHTIFTALKETNYADPYGPAARQFNGEGSYGNGAAMRSAGLALHSHKMNMSDDQAKELVDKCSRITHTHRYAINGAILMVLIIRKVLKLKGHIMNEDALLDYLIDSMQHIEAKDSDQVYTKKLKLIKQVVERTYVSGKDVTCRDIVKMLGNDVAAQNSVPLAIYSFLRGTSKTRDTYDLNNEFVRTLHWAIACGGDTDTIASMACSISGAYLGIGKIPEHLYKRCEGYLDMLQYADALFNE